MDIVDYKMDHFQTLCPEEISYSSSLAKSSEVLIHYIWEVHEVQGQVSVIIARDFLSWISNHYA